MTQKTVQRLMLNNGHHIEDRDGELVVCNDRIGSHVPYLRQFLYYSRDGDFKELVIEIVNTDIDLKKYRNSLIKQAKSLAQNESWIFNNILNDAFKENNMCKYLYTHEHVSRYISRKVWNDVIGKQHYRKSSLLRVIEDDVGSHMIRELKNVKSNRDLPAFYESIQTFMLEKFMEEHGRAKLQKALKKIVENEPIYHTQMADRHIPGRKAYVHMDETLGGV